MSASRFKSGVCFIPPKTYAPGEWPQPPQLSYFPLLSVFIDVKIECNISSTVITQKCTNPASSPAEHTKYLFPIYDGSAVTSFRCWIGNRLLEGAVRPKQQARKEFAEAVSKHKAAVLVEELTPETFETNLGQIPGQADVTVEIVLATQLKGDQQLRLHVAPRYGYQAEGYIQPETECTKAVATQDALRIHIDVSMPQPIKKIESHTHMISVDLPTDTDTFDPCKASASLTGQSASLGRKDFVLSVFSASKEWTVSRAIAVPQPDSKSSTVALTLSPGDLFRKKLNPDKFSGEVIFIVDRSGSMRTEMLALRDVMNTFLRSLPDHCSFNILSFGSQFSWLWEASRPYGQDSLDEATRHVDSFEANYGGTEILDALQSVPEHFNKDENMPTNVIVLTDGETWDVERVIEFVRETSSKPEASIRFFALGIGDQVSHRLVQGIGMRGGGSAEVISDTRSSLVWQGRVIQMLKNALMPSRLRCSISFDGLMQNGKEGLIQAPCVIPPMNAFSHLLIYYMMDTSVEELPDTLTIKAATEDGMSLTTQWPIHRSNTQSIHQIVAKAFMHDYETGQSWLHAAHYSLKEKDEDAFNRILECEAQKLGVKWSIPSRWTSYVAVDRTSQKDHEISIEAAERVESEPHADSNSEDDVRRIARHASAGGDRGGAIPVQACFGSPERLGRGGSSVGSAQMFCKIEDPEPVAQRYASFGVKDHYRARARMSKTMPLTSTATTEEYTKPSETPVSPKLTLSSVLYLQAANGEMKVEGSDIEMLLVAEFQQCSMEKMNSVLASFSVNLEPTGRPFLLSVLAVVYVTLKCTESKGLWEMQISKARRYLNKRLQEVATGPEDSEEILGKLEDVAADELLQQ